MTGTYQLMPRQELIDLYKFVVQGAEAEALSNQVRAYGGQIRSAKGRLVERMASEMIGQAWIELGADSERLSLNDTRKYRRRIQPDYVSRLPEAVRDDAGVAVNDYHSDIGVDRHIFVDGNLVMAVECKAYAEVAMLKRILVDFWLLRLLHPNLVCCLLQLESMLGGDYADPLAFPQVTGTSAHTIMSYFPDIDLNIITLLEGHRRVSAPIHRPEYFKELKPESLDGAIARLAALLSPFV